ncbi:tetratricopeptide repeat protein [Streptomyces flavofungini]|uniref:Sel1 repeat family protein n=1 Tax=Streptomyces flavofungini TaxID=68200 RepID=A0ABS0X0X1_9ACTN|nr:tetratricopeptide repeat protein [Streptomyces flavofungini]MBJ3806830.1 sel1 repeat family protein [Streptomyces flavofungini]GHC60254.1 hypothetical protein GCM10010349_29470 [Streptomyces flavofungini]
MAGNHISGGEQRDVIQAQSIGSVTFGAERAGTPQQRYLQDPDRWPLAREWDALAAGAHRARPGEDGSKLPPYVTRDVDTELRERIQEAAEDGGLVLVVGDSTAGKTRAAFEAVRELLPEHRVLAPPAGAPLRPAPDAVEACAHRRCVVWLDDLEQYLGPDGLEPELLAEFVRLRVPVVATMRLKPYETFSTSTDDGTGEQRWAGLSSRVLRTAEVVDLDRLWSAGELSRAGACEDVRIADAVAHHGTYGIAEYIAAGPVLLREWRRARRTGGGHARGAALVTAAVDLSRAGLRGPYARGLLVEVHERCLTDAGGSVLRPESLDDAFAWAARVRLGVTSPLVPVTEGWWSAFDYLVDGAESAVPDWIRETALAHAADDDDRYAIATSAYRADALRVAEAAVRPLADGGNLTATFNLALLSAKAGRTEEAEALYRHAHDNGQLDATNNLAHLLADGGRTEEAEALYRHAHAHGHPDGTFNLAVFLDEHDRAEEAEAVYRHAHTRGHLAATNNLAILLKQSDRPEEAETLLRHAHTHGHLDGTFNLAVLLDELDRTEEAESLYRHAHDRGHPEATHNLVLLLDEFGHTREAEAIRREATPDDLPG